MQLSYVTYDEITTSSHCCCCCCCCCSSCSCRFTTVLSGTTRDSFEGRQVVQLSYESYREMAHRELIKICSQIRQRWDVVDIYITHRLGSAALSQHAISPAAYIRLCLPLLSVPLSWVVQNLSQNCIFGCNVGHIWKYCLNRGCIGVHHDHFKKMCTWIVDLPSSPATFFPFLNMSLYRTAFPKSSKNHNLLCLCLLLYFAVS